MTPNVQHSTASNEHYTPVAIVEAARKVMGGIDLDPASTARVNSNRVHAAYFFDKDQDGLSKPWHGRVWLNPPGGRIGSKSAAAVWWSKLAIEKNAGRVSEAIFLGFSIEILATSQDSELWCGAMPFCIPRKRIEFVQQVGDEFVKGDSPTHSNVIVYLPPTFDRNGALKRFVDAFDQFGRCGGM